MEQACRLSALAGDGLLGAGPPKLVPVYPGAEVWRMLGVKSYLKSVLTTQP